jgi:hypothetical protein
MTQKMIASRELWLENRVCAKGSRSSVGGKEIDKNEDEFTHILSFT